MALVWSKDGALGSAAPLAMLLALAACGRAVAPSSPASYLRATPIVEHDGPSVAPDDSRPIEDLLVVELPQADTEEGATGGAEASAADAARMTESVPSRAVTAKSATTPTDVIAQANASAVQALDAEGFINAIVSYTFQSGNLYKIYAAPENVTELVLEPGEEIKGQPTAGDTLRWQLGVNNFDINGVPQQHVFLKPTRPGLTTNLTINTSRRTYYLKLESVEANGMIAVQWHYSDGELALAPSGAAAAPPAKANDRATTRPGDGAALNFDYSVEVVSGKPGWKPQAVFDDGQATFIRFDPGVLNREIPALHVRERGELQLVNYRVKGNLYVVDRLFDEAELRLGQEDQDVVRLRNQRAPGSKGPRPQPHPERTPTAARPGTPR